MPSAPATSTYGKAPSPLQTSTGALAGAIPDRGCAHIPWCAAGNAVLKVNHSCGLHVGWIIDFVARNRLAGDVPVEGECACGRSGVRRVASEPKTVTRLYDGPQCYWQPPHRQLPGQGALPWLRYHRFFQPVADTWSLVVENNHPSP